MALVKLAIVIVPNGGFVQVKKCEAFDVSIFWACRALGRGFPRLNRIRSVPSVPTQGFGFLGRLSMHSGDAVGNEPFNNEQINRVQSVHTKSLPDHQATAG